MRRLLFLFLIFSLTVFSLSSATTTTTTFSGEGRDIGFELILDRQGVDEIWFGKDKDTTHGAAISLLDFPILTDNTSDLKATVYFHWIRQASEDVRFKLSFVANTSNTEDMKGNGYMLRIADTSKANDSTKSGMNFNVSITDSSDSSKKIGSIVGESYKYVTMPAEDVPGTIVETTTDGNETVTTTTTTLGRSIVFDPDDYTSPAIIAMTIEPPKDTVDVNGKPQWQYEAQYSGYIRAEIYTNE